MANARTLRITIKRTSRASVASIIKEIKTASMNIEKGLEDLAYRVQDQMVSIISANRLRPSNKTAGQSLENNIKVHHAGPMIYGIGDRAFLLGSNPYYQRINDGGYIPPNNMGHFNGGPPVPGGTGEAWTHTGSSTDYFMRPKKPVKGLRYVEKSQHWLKVNIKSFWDNRLNRRSWAE